MWILFLTTREFADLSGDISAPALLTEGSVDSRWEKLPEQAA